MLLYYAYGPCLYFGVIFVLVAYLRYRIYLESIFVTDIHEHLIPNEPLIIAREGYFRKYQPKIKFLWSLLNV